jgi:deoxyribonuclease-2
MTGGSKMMKHLATLLLGLAIITLTSVARGKSTSVGCKDKDGNAVDWWIALKAPEGSPYGYIDSNQSPPAWAYDKILELTATNGNPLAETVQQIYGDNGAHYLIYNDQPYRLTKPKVRIDPKYHAHAKGVIAFEGDQGFWLVHSNPNFPDNPATSEYTGIYDCNTKGTTCGPKSGQQRYGQSYLCITLKADNLEKAAQLIQIAEVAVTGSNLGGTENQFPELNKIVSDFEDHREGEAPEQKTDNHVITTVGGEQLLQFAMSPTPAGVDVYLYEQLIEPKLKSGLWVETWKEGKDFVSYCPSVPSSLPEGTDFKYETRTINKIRINDDLEWTNPRTANSGDHSKWAISHTPGGLSGCNSSSAHAGTETSRRHMLSSAQAADCNNAASVKVSDEFCLL